MVNGLQDIVTAFGLDPKEYEVVTHGTGLINHTWKVWGNGNAYVLQQINKEVFKAPWHIAGNILQIKEYLAALDGSYLFVAPLPATNGEYLVLSDAEYYRLSPFVKDSYVHDRVTGAKQAREAAKQFGKFSRLLKDFDANKLKYTLPDFHNLNLRVKQYKLALANAESDRLKSAEREIGQISKHEDIADIYAGLVKAQRLPLRVMHHDTKISNVLFDVEDNGLCVIDLDTVMPGYFMSDVGDMMRTYLSPANEEERDMDTIEVREGIFLAIVQGYLSEMGSILTDAEKSLFVYSGKLMIYMQALRFLTDFLNGDIYYHTQYEGHNWVRAQNQLKLLDEYLVREHRFNEIVMDYGK